MIQSSFLSGDETGCFTMTGDNTQPNGREERSTLFTKEKNLEIEPYSSEPDGLEWTVLMAVVGAFLLLVSFIYVVVLMFYLSSASSRLRAGSDL